MTDLLLPDPEKVYPPWTTCLCFVKLPSMFLTHCCNVYIWGWIKTSVTKCSVANWIRRSPKNLKNKGAMNKCNGMSGEMSRTHACLIFCSPFLLISFRLRSFLLLLFINKSQYSSTFRMNSDFRYSDPHCWLNYSLISNC